MKIKSIKNYVEVKNRQNNLIYQNISMAQFSEFKTALTTAKIDQAIARVEPIRQFRQHAYIH